MIPCKGYEKYLPVLRECRLFDGIDASDYDAAFRFLDAKVQEFGKNEFLLAIGEPFRYAGIVLSGTVEVSFHSESHDKINMNHFTEGMLFGEALACVELMESPLQLRAATKCCVLFLNLRVLCDASSLAEPYRQRLAANLIRCLAYKNLFQRQKVQMLGQRKLRDRLMLYLGNLPRAGDGGILLPFTITTLAEYLGVNRSSLSREVSQMMDEGILRMEGKTVYLQEWEEKRT